MIPPAPDINLTPALLPREAAGQAQSHQRKVFDVAPPRRTVTRPRTLAAALCAFARTLAPSILRLIFSHKLPDCPINATAPYTPDLTDR
jgi:hypothetical protein